ncbi:chaperonin 10-like protein [Triangularia verruculosa]|uniref:Chaperonin 10-like protein n=1 Tax=Triangularia verruculosa TaxID=2587418 RepID=A0AAN6X7G4_9PEZI|nr:chaperonin 10-like protein [Triangularia verruculosa]
MSGTSFLRKMSLHKFRKSLSSPKLDGLSITEAEEPLAPPPETQTVLLLHAARQPYELTDDYPVPQLQDEQEVLVRTQAIGLNPIDWKAPDFNFAIPTLPYISGRELAGTVIRTPSSPSTRLREKDRVLVISTDYRDLRKAAYQEYVVGLDYNTVRLPLSLTIEEGSTLGVAFVAAALALGVCAGLDFSHVLDGPDLYSLVRDLPADRIAEDIRPECLDSIRSHERAQKGDWLAVWGGSSTTANLTIQLAKLAGLKTVAVVDKAKHGLRLANHKAIRTDLLVDSHDPDRAVAIIRGNLKGKLRFGIDTRGRESATSLLQALSPDNLGGEQPAVLKEGEAPPSPPSTPHDSTLLSAHLIGLTGLPKQTAPEGTLFHTVPIKLFHEVPAVGEALVSWLERLLEGGLVQPPEIIDVESGLGSVNKALDRMRKGEISGGKLVVRV